MNILSRYAFVSAYGKEQITKHDVSSKNISQNIFSKGDVDKNGVIDIEEIFANVELSQNIVNDIQSKIDKISVEENLIKVEAEKNKQIAEKIDIKNPFKPIRDSLINDNIKEIITSNEYNNFIEKEKHLNDGKIQEVKINDDTPTEKDIIDARSYQDFIDKERNIGKGAVAFEPIVEKDEPKVNKDDLIAESRRNFIEKEKEIGKGKNIFAPAEEKTVEPKEKDVPEVKTKKIKHKKFGNKHNDQLSKIEEKFKNNIPAGVKAGRFIAAM